MASTYKLYGTSYNNRNSWISKKYHENLLIQNCSQTHALHSQDLCHQQLVHKTHLDGFIKCFNGVSHDVLPYSIGTIKYKYRLIAYRIKYPALLFKLHPVCLLSAEIGQTLFFNCLSLDYIKLNNMSMFF